MEFLSIFNPQSEIDPSFGVRPNKGIKKSALISISSFSFLIKTFSKFSDPSSLNTSAGVIRSILLSSFNF